MQDFALLDADDNPITFGNFEDVSPGTDYITNTGGPLVLKVQNTTAEAKTARKLVVSAKPPYTIHTWVSLSLDGTTFETSQLALGTFAAGESKAVYCNITVPSGATGGSRQRCAVSVEPDNG
jgi:hypothetical protein